MSTTQVLAVLCAVILPTILAAENSTEWLSLLSGNKLQQLQLLVNGNKGYYFQTSFKGSYFSGQRYCRYYGMHLASILSTEENDYIQQQLLAEGANIDNLWTSGSRLADGKNWVWMSSGRRIVYTRWSPGEPNNAGGNEQCLEVRLVAGRLEWNDLDCGTELYFICERNL